MLFFFWSLSLNCSFFLKRKQFSHISYITIFSNYIVTFLRSNMYICIHFISKYWMYISNKYYKSNTSYHGGRGLYMNIFTVIIKNVYYFQCNSLFLFPLKYIFSIHLRRILVQVTVLFRLLSLRCDFPFARNFCKKVIQ